MPTYEIVQFHGNSLKPFKEFPMHEGERFLGNYPSVTLYRPKHFFSEGKKNSLGGIMNDNNVIMFFMKIKSDQESNSTGF